LKRILGEWGEKVKILKGFLFFTFTDNIPHFSEPRLFL